MNTKELVNKQREFFNTGITHNYKFRKQQLLKLKEVIISYQDKICEALKADLGKSSFESYMCEIGMTLSEISYMIKHLKKFMNRGLKRMEQR